MLKDLFQDLSTFSKYAAGVDTNSSLDDLEPSGRSAQKRICSIITDKVYKSILDSKDEDMLDSMRGAMANLTLNIQLIFAAVNRRKAEINLYKYELEDMRRAYVENYYNSIDTLIRLLSEKNNAAWKETRYYKIITSCKIISADEFDTIYPIDGSYLFYFRTVPLQKEALDERFSSYFVKADDNENILAMLKLALAKKIVAKALMRFDILEFPATIRNLFAENKSTRQGKDERDSAVTLSQSLDHDVDELLSSVDTLLSTTEESIDFCSSSAYNEPDDKILMMP